MSEGQVVGFQDWWKGGRKVWEVRGSLGGFVVADLTGEIKNEIVIMTRW